MTIGSPRRFFSSSRGRVIGRREASAGGWMFGCALIANQPPGCPLALRIVLSMRRVAPTRAATATRTSPSTRGHRREVVGAHELEVLGLDAVPAHGGQRGGAQHGRRRARRRAGDASAAAQRVAQGERALAVGAAQAHVAARQRQAVGLAHGRADLDRTGRSRSRTSAADDERLLGVLLAEEGDVGPDHVQQLGHDGGDAVEVPDAAVRALERLGQAVDVDRRREAGRVDLLGRRARRAGRRRPRPPARRRAASSRG